jgi:hypothetical protein
LFNNNADPNWDPIRDRHFGKLREFREDRVDTGVTSLRVVHQMAFRSKLDGFNGAQAQGEGIAVLCLSEQFLSRRAISASTDPFEAVYQKRKE